MWKNWYQRRRKIRRIVWKDAIFHLVFSFFNAPKSHLGRHRGKIVHSTQSCQPKLVIKIKNPLATADFNSLCFLIIELFFPHFSWCNQTFKLSKRSLKKYAFIIQLFGLSNFPRMKAIHMKYVMGFEPTSVLHDATSKVEQ